MLPDVRILAWWDQDRYVWRVFVEGIIDFMFIVCSIGRTGKQGLFDLCQHILHHSIVTDTVLGQNCRQDLTVVGIGAHM